MIGQEGDSKGKARVKVAMRVRPMNKVQQKQGDQSIVAYSTPTQIRLTNQRTFTYDHVYTDSSTQEQIYRECVQELVHKAFAGYNAAILAYGQTGTGKTYTMGTSYAPQGSTVTDANEGIIPRVAQEMFALAEERRGKMDITLSVTFIEIYNEELKDLLNEGMQPSIREAKEGTVVIENAEKIVVHSAHEMRNLLEKGGRTRITKATEMNSESSRSHAILIVFIEQKSTREEQKEDLQAISARFFFVDLAGSQRIKKTQTTGDIRNEGININLGLLHLGNVISALSVKDDRHPQHITFRNSKLTRILQDCLGGNSNTYMIACIGPSQRNEDESVSTLNYASKAKNIKNTPVINRDPQAALLLKLQELTGQNKKLRMLLVQRGVYVEDIPDRQLPQVAEYRALKEEYRRVRGQMEECKRQIQRQRESSDAMEIQLHKTRRGRDVLQAQMESSGVVVEGQTLVDKYLQQISRGQKENKQRERENERLRRRIEEYERNNERDEEILVKKNILIHRLARENIKLREEKGVEEEEEEEVGEEVMEEEKLFAERERRAREENEGIERQIRDRQREIEEMSKESSLINSELISHLRQENHQKLSVLERERQCILRRRDEAIPQEKTKYASKIESVERELRECKEKIRRQEDLERQVKLKMQDISRKDNDIRTLKKEKEELKRKKECDKRQFEKKIKDIIRDKKERIMQVMKDNRQKDSKIRTLNAHQHRINMKSIRQEVELKKYKEKSTSIKKIMNGRKELGTSVDVLFNRTIEKLFEEMKEEEAMTREQLRMKETEEQLGILLQEQAKCRVEVERIEVKEVEERTVEEVTALTNSTMQINELAARICIAQDKLSLSFKTYSSLLRNTVPFDISGQILANEEMKCHLVPYMKRLFETIKMLSVANECLEGQKAGEVGMLRQEIDSLRCHICQITLQFNNQIRSREHEEMKSRELLESKNGKGDEKEKRNLQKQVAQLTKNSRQLAQEVEIWRKKHQNVSQKYQVVRNNKAKEEKKSIMGDLNDMLDSLDSKLKKEEGEEEEDHQWECVAKIQAHTSSVLSMALHSNILITTATKSLRIWDLEKKQVISDLSGAHLGGLVKYVLVDPEKSIMFTACDKVITLWDLITVEVQGVLRYHKDEVRTIHINGDYLFSGGKGLGNNGSLLVWDMRKLHPTQPFEEKEKNQDIFSFASHNNMLYYGTRNHNIRRMNITNCEILPQFQPPHMDSVTSLAMVGGSLVSGSKDRYVKLWELDQCTPKDAISPFNDHVTTLHSTPFNLFYAGSKEGQVKVLNERNEKIETRGRIMAHTQAVNAICPLAEDNPLSFITASADKTIKIWQPSKGTNDSIIRDLK